MVVSIRPQQNTATELAGVVAPASNAPAARVDWVDAAKGLAILLVVLGHVSRGVASAGLYRNTTVPLYLDDFLYSFHVPLFFFITGLFLQANLQSNGLNNFIIRRIGTILYPYVIWSLLQGIIENLLGRHINHAPSLHAVFSLWIPRAQFWFLYSLFLASTASGILLRVSINKSYIVLLVLCSFILYLYQPQLLSNPIYASIGEGLFFVLAGVLLNRVNAFNKSTTGALCITAVFAYVVLFSAEGHPLASARQGTKAALAMCAIIAVCSILSRISAIRLRPLTHFGKHSLEIYLLHILFASGTRTILLNVFNIHDALIHVVFGATFGALLPLAFILLAQRFHLHFLFSAPPLLARRGMPS